MKILVPVLVAATLAFPASGSAQDRSRVLHVGPVFAEWTPPLAAPMPDAVAIPGIRRGPDGTVLGFVIGAAVGLVAGYAFYDLMCEAVDNNCSDSRLGSLVVGAGIGGGLGALIGSLVD